MAKVNIPRSKLRDIKQKYTESKIEALQEESDTQNDESVDLEEAISLEAAKEIAREKKINETGYTPKELIKNKKEDLAKIKRVYKTDRKIEAKWNFEVGDLVEFKDQPSKMNQIGIVVDLKLEDNHSSTLHAKKTGRALVFSSLGRVWKTPASLRKIE